MGVDDTFSMPRVLKLGSWKIWLFAFSLWLVMIFLLFLFVESSLMGKHGVLFAQIFIEYVSLPLMFFRVITEPSPDLIRILFSALFCPFVAVPPFAFTIAWCRGLQNEGGLVRGN